MIYYQVLFNNRWVFLCLSSFLLPFVLRSPSLAWMWSIYPLILSSRVFCLCSVKALCWPVFKMVLYKKSCYYCYICASIPKYLTHFYVKSFSLCRMPLHGLYIRSFLSTVWQTRKLSHVTSRSLRVLNLVKRVPDLR